MKLVIGISGASGAIYGIRALEEVKKRGLEAHLVISKWARATIESETTYSIEDLKKLADFTYEEDNLAATISSGSSKWHGMLIAPCSMKTLSGIANGYSEGLIVRAADVAIKEKRKLVLLTRETPLNAIHLENMLKLSKLGVIIMPPVPAFYTNPTTIEEIISQTVGRALEQLDVEIDDIKRWQGF